MNYVYGIETRSTAVFDTIIPTSFNFFQRKTSILHETIDVNMFQYFKTRNRLFDKEETNFIGIKFLRTNWELEIQFMESLNTFERIPEDDRSRYDNSNCDWNVLESLIIFYRNRANSRLEEARSNHGSDAPVWSCCRNTKDRICGNGVDPWKPMI